MWYACDFYSFSYKGILYTLLMCKIHLIVSKIFIIKNVKKGNWELELLWCAFEGKQRSEVVTQGEVDPKEDFSTVRDLSIGFYAEGLFITKNLECQEEPEQQTAKPICNIITSGSITQISNCSHLYSICLKIFLIGHVIYRCIWIN